MPVEINEDLCEGCPCCVRVCKRKVLQVIEGKCKMRIPEACTECGACESVCPTGAIRLV